MSRINTLSKFFFGTTVTSQNRSIDFSESGPEIKATLKVGSYSLTEYLAEIQRAMREAGSQAYVVTLNRTTQKISISAPLNFDLLRASGSRVGTSAWVMIGFSTVVDLTGTNLYTGQSIAGSQYTTQFPIDEYTSQEDSQVKENSTVNSTPAGFVQQVSFGDGSRIQMNIRLITNLVSIKNTPFYSNVNGVSDARTFMAFLLTKGRVEFMPDKDTPSAFIKCYLEGTKQDREAKRFELMQMKTRDYYQTGALTFRKVLV